MRNHRFSAVAPVFGLLAAIVFLAPIAYTFANKLNPHANAATAPAAPAPVRETGQDLAIWQDIAGARSGQNQIEAGAPDVAWRQRTLRLNLEPLAALLKTAARENTVAAAQSVIIPLPLPDGRTLRFRVVESPVFEHPERYPDLRTWRGQGIEDPTAAMRCSLTPAGFHAFVRTSAEAVTIAPIGPSAAAAIYQSVAGNDPQISETIRCLVTRGGAAPRANVSGTEAGSAAAAVTGDKILRNYRLAVAATPAYTNSIGAAVNAANPAAGALTAITQTINAVNLIYERDLAIHFNLIGNEAAIIFSSAAPPPAPGYGSGSGGVGASQLNNQTILDNVIGAANYDIGHVFDGEALAQSGVLSGVGLAVTPATCNTQVKARGASYMAASSSLLAGLPSQRLAISIVAHEIGHQFSAPHSFNGTTNGCTERDATAAYEPASGSTIMSYGSNVCGAENLGQTTADLYFHTSSIEKISAYSTTGAGGPCSMAVATSNNAPAVSAGAAYTIPARTPFTLTATGSDADNDALTYTWEQYDLAEAPAPPSTDEDGQKRPIFRSFPPTASASRTFPRLSDILANTTTLGESLPTINRTLNFRVTARDNKSGNGATNCATTAITVSNTGAAFAVTAPDTAVSWTGGSQQTVTWNVAGTNGGMINVANVRILLSTDGGNTFGATLLASAPNTGTATITVPNTPTTTARVKVEAVGNIFFDIGNANFTITAGTSCPVVTSLSPASGAAGAQVTINGSGFTGVTSLRFSNNIGASFTVNSDTLITTTVPAGATTGALTLVKSGCSGQQSTTFTVTCPAITIGTAALPVGTRNQAYTQTLSASGQTGTFTWAVTSGTLPTGLSLSTAGVLSGTPTQAGTFPLTVTATNTSTGCTGTMSYSLVINAQACPAITVDPATIGAATTGVAFTQAFTQTGGAGQTPLTLSGTLPTGLTFSNGSISGTPRQSGTFNFTITATDASQCTGNRAYTLAVSCPTITINPASLPGATVGAAYNQTITATGGATPHSYNVSAGTLPAGLALSGTGALTGTPTTPGNYSFTVRATDINGCAVARPYSVTAGCPTLTATSSSSFTATFGVEYLHMFSVTGGTGSYTYTLASGELPNSITMAANGRLSGIPLQAGTFNFTVRATDTAGCSLVILSTLTVVGGEGVAELALTQTAVLNTSQTAITYTINITNNGPGAAAPVLLTNTLPGGARPTACSATRNGVCGTSGAGNTVRFDLLPPGTTGVVTLTAAVGCASAGSLPFVSASAVTSGMPDPLTTNNNASTTTTINCVARPVVALAGGKSAFAFGAAAANGGSLSDTFSLENTGNAPLSAGFTLRRTGADVTSGRITTADDSCVFQVRMVNPDNSETTVSAAAILPGQKRSFRLLFNPRIPAPTGRTSGYTAGQLLPDAITSELTINTGDGNTLRVPLSATVDTRARLINPLAPALAPLIATARTLDEITVEASVHDPNNDLYLLNYQFLSSTGAPIGSPVGVDIDTTVTPLARGQSFTVVRKFRVPLTLDVAAVRVTLFDRTWQTSAQSAAIGTTPGRVVNVSAASYAPIPLAGESIIAAFGTNMAASSAYATGNTLPTSLAGVQVFVRDSNELTRLAELFFVSPGQINYLVPAGAAAGMATVVIARDNQVVAVESRMLENVSPGLFTAGSTGSGPGSGYVVRVRPDGAQTYEAIAQYDGARFVTRPLDFGSGNDELYLVLFGAGFRGRNPQGNARLLIGGASVEALYIGPQGGYAGLDQINVRIPRALAGRGEIDAVLSVDERQSNAVRISIR
ncbi:MAG: putative Ig domain-containing protein [Blastocatellia bacterium]